MTTTNYFSSQRVKSYVITEKANFDYIWYGELKSCSGAEGEMKSATDELEISLNHGFYQFVHDIS